MVQWRAFHRIALWLMAVAVTSCPPPRVLAAETVGAGPKITGARIGFAAKVPISSGFVAKQYYKLGFWTPVRVEVAGADVATNLSVEVIASDSDGVPTTAAAELAPHSGSDGRQSVVVYTMAGRVGSPIKVSLKRGEQEIDSLVLTPNPKVKSEAGIVPVPATSELIVSLGSASIGLNDAFPDREATTGQTGRKLIELDSIAELPQQWFGYEAVDVFVIAAGDGKLVQELKNDTAKYEALERWVELGGRLVILSGGASSQSVLDSGGPLASLSPGKLVDVVRLPNSGSLEHFAASAVPIAGNIQVPRLADVDGNIEVYFTKPTDLPLIVRTARGFGEITFAGLDFSQPPLAAWSGRTAFLRALLRPYVADVTGSDSTQRLVTSGFNDLSGALRQQLGRTFAGVAPIGFPMVTALALAYLLFLGPLDYLLINRWLRRPLWAWISFPIIVAAFSLLAVAAGNWSKGAATTRVNRLQLIDIDALNDQTRGTMWATVFSPEANQFDLEVRPPAASDGARSDVETLFSWWGLPGLGIGGMQTAGADLGIVRTGYRYGLEYMSLEQVPVLASATKSLRARWTGGATAKMDAQLTDEGGLVVGSLTNQTGLVLRNARLLYGSWAHKLGTLNAGEHVEVGEQLRPLLAKTVVTRDALGETAASGTQIEGRVFAAEHASAKEILSLMMFYDTAGGFAFAHLPNRYQAYVDLSRQLDLGRAVLVADVQEPGAQLIEKATGHGIGDDKLDASEVIYRFVLPVKRPAAP